MLNRSMLALIVAVQLVLCAAPTTYAQDNAPKVTITQVDGSSFPLVTVFVSVLDSAGQPVSGITQGQVTLTEDGVPVKIVGFQGGGGVPINTLLIVDHSGSMQGQKIDAARQAGLTFVDLMRPQDQVGVLAFDNTAQLVRPLTTDQVALRHDISALAPAGGTALYDAVIAGLEPLKPVAGRKSAIVLSDGMDNRDGFWQRLAGQGSQNSLTDAISQATSSGATLYTIGLGQRGELNEDALRQLAEKTGGTYFYAPSTGELAGLYQSLANQFHTEYALTYRSPRAFYDGTRRGINVTLKASDGQSVSAGNTYLEQHLLQLRSTPIVGTVLLSLLLVALCAPLAVRRRPARLIGGTAATAVSLSSNAQAMPSTPQTDITSTTVSAPPAARTCASCGTALQATSQFCHRCGWRQP
jgi:VWFA-related protein